MVSIEDVRRVARDLPRSEEPLIKDRVKFRVGKIVYVASSSDRSIMGFGFPRRNGPAWSPAAP